MMRKKHIFRLILASTLLVWLVAIGILIMPSDDSLPELPTEVAMLPPADSQVVDNSEVSEPVAIEDATEDSQVIDAESVLANADVQTISARASESVVNQFTIQFQPDVTIAERDAYLNSIDATVQNELAALNTVVVQVADDVVPGSSSIVSVSEPDYYVVAAQGNAGSTNDPHFALQWNLEAIDANDARAALPLDASPVTVAVIDSGVCAEHPDLAGRIVDSYDFVENDNVAQDEFEHGCAVAGIIAANINNNLGIAGIAPNAQIMALRVLDAQGVGTYSDTAGAIIYAVDNGASIINLSLGGLSPSAVLEGAINYAVSQGVTVIAAAGNTGDTTVLYPAAYDTVIAVGATNAESAISSFSSRGSQIDLWAPGENIVSLLSNGNYAMYNGTSYAAPHVSAVAALEMAFGTSLITEGQLVISGHDASPDGPGDIPDSPSTSYENNPRFDGIDNVTYAPDVAFLTDMWIVEVAEGTDGVALAQSLGFMSNGAFPNDPDTYVFEREGSAQSAELSVQSASALASSSQVVRFEQVIAQNVRPRQFSDPLYPDQWHLNNTGQNPGFVVGMDSNAVPAWNAGYTGSGVLIAIVDDGLQYTHPDLSSQYDASASYDYVSNDALPLPFSGNDGHGTSVAGVAAANDETTCGVGAAHDANLAGIRLYGDDGHAVNATSLANVWSHDSDIDIYNNSWGLDITNANLWGNAFNEMEDQTDTGRSGLGIIYVHAAGNAGRLNIDTSGNPIGIGVNSSPLTTTRFTIPVAALTPSGFRADYSSVGDAVFIAASSSTHLFTGAYYGTTTTDLLGTDGSSSGNCNNTFNGTSSAAPLVSGVIALMLDANPNLTWRDVRHILVETAERVDTGDSDFYSDWSMNDGGYYFSRSYGFGNIDAGAATAAATSWTTVPAEVSVSSGTRVVNATIPTNDTYLSESVTISDEIRIEQVEVRFSANHPFRGDIFMVLESPQGSFSPILASNLYDDSSNGNYVNQLILSNRFWGESSEGTWTLHVTDTFPAFDVGSLVNFEVRVHGFYTNNNIDHAEVLSNSSVVDFDNTGATRAADDPTPSCGTVERSMWYTYTAATSGELTVDLDQSGAIAIFSGTPGSLTEIDCVTGNPASLSTFLTASGTYYILVGGNNSTPVIGQVSLDFMSNDDVADAFAVSNSSVVMFDNSGASTEAGDPSTSCEIVRRSMWYTYTASGAEDLRIMLERNTNGGLPTIAVYSGTPGALSQLDCAYGVPTGVNVNLPGAGTYYIMVGGTNMTGFAGQMTLSSGFSSGTIVVNNDGADNSAALRTNCNTGVGNCTLPAAVEFANGLGTNPTIAFAVGTGIERINAPNITISNSMTIDATTQHGYAGTPILELYGNQFATQNGFIIDGADNVTIRGFAIGNFFDPSDSVSTEKAIEIVNGSSNVLIEDNWMGIGASGIVQENGNAISISMGGGSSITIDDNVIVNSRTWGILTAGANVTVTNNFIGIAPDGVTSMGNGIDGVIVGDTPGDTYIGLPGNGNVISGNIHSSIQVQPGTSNVYIRSNLIGTDHTGTIGISGDNRIMVGGLFTNNIIIGGNSPGEGNVLSSNGGVFVEDDATTSDISILNNYFGLDITGTQSIPNDTSIYLGAGYSNVENNVIAGNNPNEGAGIHVTGDLNTILGNIVGLDVNGDPIGAFGNFGNYIGILVEGDNNFIGGSAVPGYGNFISHNHIGILVEDSTQNDDTVDGNLIESNIIGLDDSFGTAFPNNYGIVVGIDATNTTIGGNTTASANTISGNFFDGIRIGTLPAMNTPNTGIPTGTVITGNYIGTNALLEVLGNSYAGIHLKDGQDTIIGGSTTAESNLIAFNSANGITLEYTNNLVSNDNNRLFGNIIYGNGGRGIDLNDDGVTFNDLDDVDDGPNDLQNFPNLLAVAVNNGANTTTIDFELDGVPNTNYRVDFYYNSNSCDIEGHGEGENWITNSPVPATFLTDGTGYYSGSIVITGMALNSTDLISMLATDTDRGNTSEFSKCPLSPPVGFAANAVSQVQINLSWTGNNPQADMMTIERSLDGVSGWVEIANFALPDDLAHSDTGLDCGTTYYYRAKNSDTVEAITSAYTEVDNASTSACPPNDDFANVTTIASVPFTDAQQTFGATSEISDPVPSCGTNVSKSIWYSITPATSGVYTINTIGADYDALLSLWIDSGGLVEQACNFNGALSGQASITMQLTGSTTYYIMLSGNNDTGGNAVINVDRLPDPTATPQPTVPPAPTVVPPAVTNTVGLFNPANNLWQFRDTNASGNIDITFFWGTGQNNQALIGDWNGDNVDGIGLYHEGVFIFRNLSNGGAIDSVTNFGPAEAGWQAIAGDWNGDDSDSVGIYKEGQFRLTDDNSGVHYIFNLGPAEAGWTPVAGDWNGDGFDTVGLYKNGTWLLSTSSTNPGISGQITYGPASDSAWIPVTGDWNADNMATIGLYGSGLWRVRANDSFGGDELIINFGSAGDWVALSSYRGGVVNLSLLSSTPLSLPAPSPVAPVATMTATPGQTIVPEATATQVAPVATAEPETTQEAP